MANLVRKFFILLWKNFIGKKRHWIGTILEVVIPSVLFAILVVLRTEGGEGLNPHDRPAESWDEVMLPAQVCGLIPNLIKGDKVRDSRLLYYPDNDAEINKVMATVESTVNGLYSGLCSAYVPNFPSSLGKFSVLAVKSPDEIQGTVSANNINPERSMEIYGGVEFKISDTGLQYTMRFSKDYTQVLTEFVYMPFSLDGPQKQNGEAYDTQTAFQALIDLAYIQHVTGENLLPDLTGQSVPQLPTVLTALQQMVYPAYIENNLALILNFMMPTFLILSFSFIVPPTIKRIVYEKETGVKELMKMMGLPSWLHWLTWFLSSAITIAVSIIIITILLHVSFKEETGPVLNYSDASITFLFIYLYACALITQLFALSTLFSRPNTALAISVLFHILTFNIPNNIINQTADGASKIPFGSKIVLALFPNININWGIKIILDFESKGLGSKWSNLYKRTSPQDPMTMGVVLLMFCIDMLFYSILIWYLDSVRPGKFGVARPWFFPCMPSTWCKKGDSFEVVPDLNDVSGNDPTMFEKDPDLRAGVRVRGLRKEFPKFRKSPVVAVERVDFSAYEGEITTLLGHNGAGKTTTMSVLTGLYSATAGQAEINGYNIATDMNMVRQNLGLCPQHNMLFEDLTVREHLVFFGMLKGLSKANSETEAKMYIQMLNLIPKTDVNVSKLSGGMKRKVNLGIALIGGSKVVMLDEPTSGMDPEARRGMWDLLLSLKSERTILLTTHFMEEADVLGDRIAIMSKGKVRCYGTPFFLKRRFGSGYTLRVDKNLEADTSVIFNTVKSNVEGANLLSENAEELQISFPTDQSTNLPEMFRVLETKSKDFGIEHLGLSLTTMEDVFLKIGEMDHEEEIKTEMNGGHTNGGYMNGHHDVEAWRNEEDSRQGKADYQLMQGFNLVVNQLRGLFVKRAIYTWRRPILYLTMMLVPIGMCLFQVLSLNSFQDSSTVYEPREISLGDYTDPITYYSTDSANEKFGDPFKNNIMSGVVEKVDNVTGSILEHASGHENLAKYQDQYIIGGDFYSTTFDFSGLSIPVNLAVGVFNTVPLHSKPLAQLKISNALLETFDTDPDSNRKISVTTHPLPNDNAGQFENVANGDGTLLTFAYGTGLPIGLSILVSSFVIFPLNERTTNAKQVQIMTGLNPVIFWISNLLWDNILYLISSLIMVGLAAGLDDSNVFSDYGAPGAFLLIVMLLGWFGIPFSYVMSFLFSTAAGGFSFLIIVNVLAGSIAPLAVFLLRQFGDEPGASEGLGIASDVVRWIFNIFPIFPFSRALMAIITVQESNHRCNKIEKDTLNLICEQFNKFPQLVFNGPSNAVQYAQCCTEESVGENAFCDKRFPGDDSMSPLIIPCHAIESFFTWDRQRGINTDLVVLIVDGFILFFILVLIERKYTSRLLAWIRSSNGSLPPAGKLDDDVLAEQERVTNFQGQDILRVFDLRKVFGGFHAVRGLSFGVKPGECFGLLGINGAGKTTSFRMLTGDEVPTAGVASLLGNSLKNDRSRFLQQIGYCPQFDSIIPELTGRELLTLMCRVRGVPPKVTEREVQRWTDFLEIQQYINRESGSYSGGNKRKLNVAMSLVGEPPIVFLDEPSTGVDPVARRNLWSIIQRIQRNGQSVVLTSHSMEECEYLCDRLGIMVNGQFQCFGTVNHLKNKFAQGFSLQMKLNVEEHMAQRNFEAVMEIEESIIAAIQNKFREAGVKDRHMGYLQFTIENPNIPLHVLFSSMEEIKRQHHPAIDEYSLRETTLEQVFLSFAKQQTTTL